jgi:hypothetical protein
MFKKSLLKPLLLLWVGIIAVRILLAKEVLGQFLSSPWLNIAFLIISISTFVAEILILLKAAKAYKASAQLSADASNQNVNSSRRRGTRSAKRLIAVFALCLPYAIWEQRNDLVGILTIAVGGAINLLWTAYLAHTIFLVRNATNQSPAGTHP